MAPTSTMAPRRSTRLRSPSTSSDRAPLIVDTLDSPAPTPTTTLTPAPQCDPFPPPIDGGGAHHRCRCPGLPCQSSSLRLPSSSPPPPFPSRSSRALHQTIGRSPWHAFSRPRKRSLWQRKIYPLSPSSFTSLPIRNKLFLSSTWRLAPLSVTLTFFLLLQFPSLSFSASLVGSKVGNLVMPTEYMDENCDEIIGVGEVSKGRLELTRKWPYNEDVRCSVVIMAPPRQRLLLRWAKMDLFDKEETLECDDRIFVYDGKDDDAILLTPPTGICGHQPPSQVRVGG